MEGMARIQEWMAKFLEAAPQAGEDPQWSLPFSFQYDNQPVVPKILQWDRAQENTTLADGTTQSTITFTDPTTKLQVEWKIKQFNDFPAVEWVLYLSNQGKQDTPIINDLKCLHARFSYLKSPGDEWWLDTLNGGRSSADDFYPRRFLFGGWQSTVLDSPTTSSDTYAPFFNISSLDSGGIWIGLGWLGSWQATFANENGAPVVDIGIRQTHFRLRPGERVRGMRVLLMMWDGERLHAQNMGRQLIVKHYIPKTFGDPPVAPLTTNVCFTYDNPGDFLEKADAESVLAEVPFFADLGVDYFVIDAGWYELNPKNPQWYSSTGSWALDRKRYPQGLQPIADALGNTKLVLWIRPMDNGNPESLMAQEHPEFLLEDNKLVVDLNNPAAREWIVEKVERLWAQGLRGYRHDGPMYTGLLDALDSPDRIGIAQMKQAEGLCLFWDALIQRFPGIVMEGCTDGGRSICLDTISRFSIYQKSDRWFNSEEDQVGAYGFNMFLPGSILNLPTNTWNEYGFRSSMAGQICLGWNPFREDLDKEKARTLVDRYKELRHFLTGDYYPLTPLGMNWLGMQFNRDDLQQGMALIFRRQTSTLPDDLSPAATMNPSALKLYFRGLDKAAEYEVCSENTGKALTLTGETLMTGYEISLPEAPASEIIIYKRVK